VRLYSDAGEQTLRARGFLKDWAGEGFLTAAQYQRMQQETVSDLRCTNIFLRVVLFLFTLLIVGAGAGLFFTIFLSSPSRTATGVFLLIFAGVSYAAAEIAVSRARLYRYGIEEALAVCSVGFLCVGIQAVLFSANEFLVPAAGAIASLWIWHRFGFFYAFPAAMIFAVFLPGYWTSSHAAQHLIVTALYTTGLIALAVVRSGDEFDSFNDGYSLAEAFLWLGVYIAINLQLSSLNLPAQRLVGVRGAGEYSSPFYWATWVLIWCLPPAVLVRGVRRKDRFIIIVGGLLAILTLATNKPYLGWQRHSWDPMLLGVVLIAGALLIRRWLAHGREGIRHGFTAERLSGKHKEWMNAGSAVLGLASAHSLTTAAQTTGPEVRFGGGDSGGGGATSDF
jgi:hypothetical protein